MFRKVLSTYLPRYTGDVLVATEVMARMLPCPSRPRRLGSAIFTLPEARPVDASDTVVPGEPFIYEGIVGVQKFKRAAVISQNISKEEFGLLAESFTDVVVEIGEQQDVGNHL